MHIIRASMFALGLLVWPASQAPVTAQTRAARTKKAPTVRFEFDVKRDVYDTPTSRVFLRVDGQRFFVSSFQEGFNRLSRAEFTNRKVPREALAACSGWWAGAGDNLYVVRRGTRLDVYRQQMDEQSGPFPYRRIKSIRFSPLR